jgi:hypothetical protein
MDRRHAGSSWLAVSRQRQRRGRDRGLVPEIEADRADQPEADRAAERTARAEASLVKTEQKIHQIADEVRDDLKGSGNPA